MLLLTLSIDFEAYRQQERTVETYVGYLQEECGYFKDSEGINWVTIF